MKPIEQLAEWLRRVGAFRLLNSVTGIPGQPTWGEGFLVPDWALTRANGVDRLVYFGSTVNAFTIGKIETDGELWTVWSTQGDRWRLEALDEGERAHVAAYRAKGTAIPPKVRLRAFKSELLASSWGEP